MDILYFKQGVLSLQSTSHTWLAAPCYSQGWVGTVQCPRAQSQCRMLGGSSPRAPITVCRARRGGTSSIGMQGVRGGNTEPPGSNTSTEGEESSGTDPSESNSRKQGAGEGGTDPLGPNPDVQGIRTSGTITTDLIPVHRRWEGLHCSPGTQSQHVAGKRGWSQASKFQSE